MNMLRTNFGSAIRLILAVCLFTGCVNNSKDRVTVNAITAYMPDSVDRTFVGFSNDSSLKIVYDSILHIWNCKTGTLIREFDLNSTDSIFVSGIRCLAVYPKGRFIVIIDDEGMMSAWDVRKGTCIRFITDNFIWRCNYLEFSNDGRFLMSIDYREATVDMYGWPGLNYIATGSMGRYRNSFNWENRNGKLIFYYEGYDGNYKTVFPVKTSSGQLRFKTYRIK